MSRLRIAVSSILLSFFILTLHAAPPSTFTCKDGTVIPISRVNDDYCDCPADGSDEPGTSACFNGHFHCQNKGHMPLDIPSSFVRDGYCDCCDGSDEHLGVCQNTCKEAGAAAREAARKALETTTAGLQVKTEQITRAKQIITEKEQELAGLKKQLEEQNIVVSQLEGSRKNNFVMTLVETKNRVQAEQDKLEAELRAKKDAEQAAAKPEQENNQDQAIGEIMTEPEIAIGPAPDPQVVPTEDNQEGHIEETVEQEVEEPPNVPLEEEFPELMDEVEDSHNSSVIIFFNWLWTIICSPFRWIAHLLGLGSVDHYSPAVNDATKKAQSEYNAAHSIQRELETKISNIETLLATDFGPEKCYLPDDQKCFSVQVEEYTYEICLLDKASQKSGSSTSLGNFAQWENNYHAMNFSNGVKCWNGPDRSAKVDIVCGTKTELLSANEPARCEYHMILASPCGCDEETLKEQATKLAQLEL